MARKRILATFPGKLGDLVYTLPAVRAIHEQLEADVTCLTSAYCRAALPLLKAQGFLAGAAVDQAYILEHVRYGCQPWNMSEPPGFDRIIHLGFRPELLERSVLERHLIDTFYWTLQTIYGLVPPYDPDRPFLEVESGGKGPYVVFSAFGITLMDLMKPDARAWLELFWKRLLPSLGLRAVAVCGPAERDYHASFGCEVLCPGDLLETARLIRDSRCFIGVQSAAAAVADGLKHPRLVFNWFRNAVPRGPNALTFSLGADPVEVGRAVADMAAL